MAKLSSKTGKGKNANSLANLKNKTQIIQKKMSDLVSEYSKLKIVPSPEIFDEFESKYNKLIDEKFDIESNKKIIPFNKEIDAQNIDSVYDILQKEGFLINASNVNKSYTKKDVKNAIEKGGNLKKYYKDSINKKYFNDDVRFDITKEAFNYILKEQLKNVKQREKNRI